jgi:hypothetical protein
MSQPMAFAAYMRDEHSLRDRQIIEPLCVDLVAQGYHLVCESETATTFSPWWKIMIASAFSPSMQAVYEQFGPLTPEEQGVARDLSQRGISAALRAELDTFFSQEGCELRLRAYHTQHVLEFIIELSLSSWFSIEVDRDYLTGDYEDEGVRAYERWLEVTKLLYRHLHPFYGAVVFDEHFYPPEEQSDWEDVRSGKINGLSLVNILGADLVRRYGRERLLTMPAWNVEELDDGGILLLPEPYWYGYVPTWRRATQHLGISCIIATWRTSRPCYNNTACSTMPAPSRFTRRRCANHARSRR